LPLVRASAGALAVIGGGDGVKFKIFMVAGVAVALGVVPVLTEAQAAPVGIEQAAMRAVSAEQERSVRVCMGSVLELLGRAVLDVALEAIVRELREWLEKPGGTAETLRAVQSLIQRLSDLLQRVPFPDDISLPEVMAMMQQALQELAKLSDGR
jgi:hypothetical protein